MGRKAAVNSAAAVVLVALAVLAALSVYRPPGVMGNLLWRMELGSYDSRLSTRASRFPQSIVIVSIDDESLQQVGVWPWPRSVHAELISKLSAAGARLIGMDIVFSELSGNRQTVDPDTGQLSIEPLASQDDQALARAISASGRVVLAAEISNELATRGEHTAATVTTSNLPHDMFAAGMLDAGVTNVPRDPDSVVRRTWLTLTHQDEAWPTLPVMLAAHYRKQDPEQLAALALRQGAAGHPYLDGDTILVNFCGPAGTISRYSYYQVLEGVVSPEVFRDKIVLVGASAAILQDIYPTPMARAEPGTIPLARVAPMPGVEVQANVLATLLSGSYVRPASIAWLVVALTCAALLIIGTTLVLRPLRALLVLLATLFVAGLVCTLLLWREHLWLPLIPLILTSFIAYTEGTVYMYLTEERARLNLRRAWQQRVSAEVLQVILNHPVTKVQGRKIEATVMFTDLRGFTTMCHTCAPEVVIERLNEYLTAMTEEIRRFGGTIHKFIGDGIMAVFGDPVAHPDHALRACRAALAMQERMAVLAESAIACGDTPLRMGVGIHTGELVSGDIGSEALLEYTVIGDTVSTASRIESLNKDLKTGILLSGQTRAALGEADLPLRHIVTQSVRGRDEELDLYTLDTPEAAPGPTGQEKPA